MKSIKYFLIWFFFDLLVFLITFLKTVLSSFFLFFLSFFSFFLNLPSIWFWGKQGQSILHQVCGSYSVNLPIVKLLVENGADINGINQVFSNLIFFWMGVFESHFNHFFSKGSTPLMTLIQFQHFGSTNERILFMLQNGVEINKTNEVFHISLFFGVLFGNNSFNPKW